MTQQHFKAECDIHTILDRYEKTGYLVDPLQIRTTKPMFDDWTQVPDFREVQERIIAVKEMFDGLPAKTREIFNNDPANLVEYLASEPTTDQLVEMGIIDQEIIDVPFDVATPVVSKDSEVKTE